VGDRELVWRTVPTVLYPDSTEWRIKVHDDGGRARIEQAFDALKAPPKVLDVLYATLLPSHRDRSDAIDQDLLRLGARAAGSPCDAPRVRR
jgi:hypothetical protein